MRQGKTQTINAHPDDFSKIKAWSEEQVGLSIMGALHQIVELAYKHKPCRNSKGQFTQRQNKEPEDK